MIAIFNPEHDLCLANGDRNFVPPQSALTFARESAQLLKILYGNGAYCTSADSWQPPRDFPPSERLVAWGWDARLLHLLQKKGVPPTLLPAEEKVEKIRLLQHRSSLIPIQQEIERHGTTPAPLPTTIRTEKEAQDLLQKHPHIVLKAPWSGSGRGLRWVSHTLSPHDSSWIQKIVREQDCVVVEKRHEIALDFAIEYQVLQGAMHKVGYSLFRTQGGIYRANLLLSDNTIQQTIQQQLTPTGIPITLAEKTLSHWLRENIAPHYEGYLGVDFFVDKQGHLHLSEINLRHTMGLLAHEYLRQHPEKEGKEFTI